MNYFLVIFIDFFIFLNLNSNLNFGGVYTARYRYRTPAVTAVTAVYRAVPSGKKNPGHNETHTLSAAVQQLPCAARNGVLAFHMCHDAEISRSSALTLACCCQSATTFFFIPAC
jgi:hypothetical protein